MTGTILVVDDVPQNLRLLEAVLSPRGYTVVTASSGEEALRHMIRAAEAPVVSGDARRRRTL